MTESKNGHLAIWDAMSTVPEKFTKKRWDGLTAIDAYWQFQKATELFGPVGKGWGWIIEEQGVVGPFYQMVLTLWWMDEDTRCSLQVINWTPVKTTKKKGEAPTPDAEAPKKCLTGALTKALSYLGSGAEVFMGLFEDEAHMKEKRAAERGESVNRDTGEITTPKRDRARQMIENQPQRGAPRARAKQEPDWLDEEVGFGKHSERSWRYMGEKHPDYLDWLAKKGRKEEDRDKATWVLVNVSPGAPEPEYEEMQDPPPYDPADVWDDEEVPF